MSIITKCDMWLKKHSLRYRLFKYQQWINTPKPEPETIKLKIHITKNDIRKGLPKSKFENPIALSISRNFNGFVHVERYQCWARATYRIDVLNSKYEYFFADLEKDAITFLENFNNKKRVYPKIFTVIFYRALKGA